MKLSKRGNKTYEIEEISIVNCLDNFLNKLLKKFKKNKEKAMKRKIKTS